MSSARPEAPAEPLLRLRRLGLGEILDDIFRIYRRHFLLLIGISLILSLPNLMVQLASGTANLLGLSLSVFNNLGRPPPFAEEPFLPVPNFFLIGVSYLVLLLAVPFTMGAISQAAIDIALARPVTIRSVFSRVLARYLPLLLLSLLFAAMVLVGIGVCVGLLIGAYVATGLLGLVFGLGVIVFFAAVIVAVFLAVRWSVAVPALLAERLGPVRAIGRSWGLTRGNWWRLFGTLIVMYLLQTLIASALGVFAFPVAIAVPFVEPVVRGAIALTISTAASAVTLPIDYLCFVLLYFDLRIRHEDFDLDQLARQAVGSAMP